MARSPSPQSRKKSCESTQQLSDLKQISRLGSIPSGKNQASIFHHSQSWLAGKASADFNDVPIVMPI
jgi:hypothetical protein